MDKAERLALLIAVKVASHRYREIEQRDPKVAAQAQAIARVGIVYHDLAGDDADPRVDNPELAGRLSEMFGAPDIHDREAVRGVLALLNDLAAAAKIRDQAVARVSDALAESGEWHPDMKLREWVGCTKEEYEMAVAAAPHA